MSLTHERGTRTVSLLPLAVTLIGAFVLMVAADEEPYHIDELRQTRKYGVSFAAVINESRGQEQPPLDPLLNAAVQRVIGQGDIRQRLLSVAFSVGSLVVVWRLMARSKFSELGTSIAIAVMAFTPALLVVSAYARPYALPLFLMLTLLLLADRWLDDGGGWNLAIMVFVALVLPWSRTVEPVIFLGLTACAALWLVFRSPENRRRAAAVGGVAVLGLLSSFPAYRFVSNEISDRAASLESGLFTRLTRLFGEIPETVAIGIQYWPLLLILVILLITDQRARHALAGVWWWWVMAGTAVGFTLAFAAIAPETQAFSSRYLFTFVPPLAVMVGVTVSSALSRESSGRLTRYWSPIVVPLVMVVAVAGTWVELTRASRADWKAVSQIIVNDLPEDTVVLYDAVVPLGEYKTPFAGRPRYTGDYRRIPNTLQVISEPSLIVEGRNTAMVLVGRTRISVPGWTPVSVDGFFTVYLPSDPHVGREGAASAYVEFAEAMEPEMGASLLLSAAAIYNDMGDSDKALELTRPLLEDEILAPTVRETVQGTPLDSVLFGEGEDSG